MRKTAVMAVVLASALAAAQRDFSKVEIKSQKVAGSVYMLEGAGGNIGVSAGEDGLVVVDSQYAPLAPKIEAAMKAISGKPVRFLLNTHWHGDHTGGNALVSRPGTILAHENVRKRLESGGKTRFGEVKPADPAALPIVTFNDRASIFLNGEELRAIHFPNGHTDGDSVIFFTKSNVVHMGDDFFNGNFPFIDLDSGGSVQGYLAGVEKVLAQVGDDTRIIPGHGPLAGKADLQKFAAMLRDTSAAVQGAMKAGKSPEEMKKERVLAKWEAWGKGFINEDTFIDILYADLSKKRTGVKYNPHGHDHGSGK